MGDWGLGIGDWAQSPIPNPQSPIPNPHLYHFFWLKFLINSNIYIIINISKYKSIYAIKTSINSNC